MAPDLSRLRYRNKTMKLTLLLCLVCVATLPAKTASHSSHVSVRAHTTKTGKTVAQHHRTKANKTDHDNWSTKTNVNPDTGKKGTKNSKR
jgi:hypothetical protein